MKPIILSISLITLCGCSTTDITQLTQALAKDPATVHFRATSVYGTVDFTRVGATNGLTISPDGSIQVK